MRYKSDYLFKVRNPPKLLESWKCPSLSSEICFSSGREMLAQKCISPWTLQSPALVGAQTSEGLWSLSFSSSLGSSLHLVVIVEPMFWEVRVGRTGILANVSITVRQLGLEQVSTPFPVLFHYTGLRTEHSSANWNRNLGLGLGGEMIIPSPFIWCSCLFLRLFRGVRDLFIGLTWDSNGWIGIVLEAWLHEINNNENDFAVDGNSAILSNQSV